MGEPGLWAPNDLDTILGSYGAFIVERSGTDIDQALGSLGQYEHNIWVISQVIQKRHQLNQSPLVPEEGSQRQVPDSGPGRRGLFYFRIEC